MEPRVGTNLTGAWLICRAAVPDMLAAGSCRVVLLTSEAGWAFTPGVGAYNVSKSALNNLGASLAAECAARYPAADVQINVLIPGEARTEMNQGSTDQPLYGRADDAGAAVASAWRPEWPFLPPRRPAFRLWLFAGLRASSALKHR